MPYVLLAVPVSSLLGLLRVMLIGGGGVLARVWSANLWGDVAFVAGTIAAAWVSATIAAARGKPTGLRFTVAVAAGFAMHYVVYLLSWSLSAFSFLGGGEGGFTNPNLQSVASSGGFFAFHLVYPNQVAWDVLRAGFVGLVAMAFAGPLVGLFLPGSAVPGNGNAAARAK